MKLQFNGFRHTDTFTTYYKDGDVIKQVTVERGSTFDVPDDVGKKLLADHGEAALDEKGKPTPLVPIVRAK